MALQRLVVLDFEATCDDKPTKLPQKIIEFPAVVVCAKSMSTLTNPSRSSATT